MHLISPVRECDTSFVDYLWTIEKKIDEEVDSVNMSPTYTQLSAALYSRLIDVISREAFRIVEMTAGKQWLWSVAPLEHEVRPADGCSTDVLDLGYRRL